MLKDRDTEVVEITLSDVMRHAVDGMFVIDRQRQVVLFSEGCERITGADRTSVIGTPCPCHQFLECRDRHDRSLSGVLCPALSIFRGAISSSRQRMSLRHSDGRRVWVETTYSPVYDEDGTIACVVGIMRDMSHMKEMEGEHWGETEPMDPLEARMAGNNPRGERSEDGDVSKDQSDDMGPLDRILSTVEKREILAALRRANGQRTLAARLLGISRSRLYRRMDALGIDPRGMAPFC